jgi:hypothetical protein
MSESPPCEPTDTHICSHIPSSIPTSAEPEINELKKERQQGGFLCPNFVQGCNKRRGGKEKSECFVIVKFCSL